ncbi:PepSY domain-containing protein [Cupriavidus pinatubonensis]|uniref:PepSY domain-containing protein n=1 Tax=Cupriavidus pinatubonensis TaxID=248026 RepID=UPI0015E2F35E|nr:PepSY domain-containing protein [Cupriavidus pinatubonensis]
MKHLRIARGLALTMVALVGAAGIHPALAHDSDDCEAPVNAWKPRDAVRTVARQKGWQIDRLRIDDGCYEVKGHDAEGRRFKAKLDPVTLDVVRIKLEDADHGGARGQRPDANAGKPPADAPPEGLMKPGTKPQVQIR